MVARCRIGPAVYAPTLLPLVPVVRYLLQSAASVGMLSLGSVRVSQWSLHEVGQQDVHNPLPRNQMVVA